MGGEESSTSGAAEDANGRTLVDGPDAAKTAITDPQSGVQGTRERSGSEPSRTAPLEATTIDLPGPETVLRKAEIEQTRRTAIAGVVFNALGLVAVPLVGGDAFARQIFIVALVLALLNNVWLWYVTAAADRYRSRHALVYFAVAPLFNAAVLYYCGIFGPIVVIFVLNIYSACLGYGRRVATVTLVGAIAPMALLGGGVTFGVIDDVGLITVSHAVDATARGFIVSAFILFLYLVYAQARSTRRVIVASLVDRDEAVRKASHREAMFLEARQDLERALYAGGMGRFTDQTLGGYKLGAVIGRGGMGEVYEAVHAETGDAAAVKMLLPEVLARPDYVRRFMREVRIAASLDSPHVVRVLDIGDESAPLPYLAMELLRGEDLAQLLRRVERLRPKEVVALVREAGRAATAAAAAGIVHRDLKPQNLFLTDGPPPVWKVLDFGVSKLVSGVTITHGETVGTPQYMAPEQARGAEVDMRTDLYAIGAIAYRALTGLPPFSSTDMNEVLVAVMQSMPVRPSLLARLPAEVDLVLAVALAKSPDDRFATADELADALDEARHGRIDDTLRVRASRLVEAHPWSDVR